MDTKEMVLSVQRRLLIGFGFVLAIMVGSAALSWMLIAGIDDNFAGFREAINERSAGVEMDLQAQKIRVRVNQWLRSMNPDFATQADTLLAQFVPMTQDALAASKTGKTRDDINTIIHALALYTESWRVIKGLYADEARLYAEGTAGQSALIMADLADARAIAASQDNASATLFFADAREDMREAQDHATRFRANLKAEDSQKALTAMAALHDKLVKAAASSQDARTTELLKHAETAARIWEEAFARAIGVAKMRADRLVTWTRDEGEVMAVGANAVRAAGEEHAKAKESAQSDAIATGRTMLYGVTAAALVLGIISSMLLARSITGPLARITKALKALASGDRTVEIPETGRRDEIGEMAKSAQVFKENAIAIERLVSEQESAKKAAAAAQRAALNETASAFELRVGQLVSTVSSAATELEATAQAMTGTARDANGQASTVAAAAEEASVGVATVAAAAEQLTASIAEISRQVEQSSLITAGAVADAQRTDGIVQKLSQGADKIGHVVGLITNIAGQTNLLALNATIEAARAATPARASRSVASEVKSLANQTAKATEEISAQISEIQAATKDAVLAIRSIAGTIEQVSSIAVTIAAAVQQQGAATGEIARNVQRTATSTKEVTTNIAGVSHAATETGAAAGQVLDAAGELSRQAERLTSEVGGFIAEVRAA